MTLIGGLSFDSSCTALAGE